MSARILAMGDGLWDLFPDGPRFGGATANYACHASRLGADVHMVSGVGEDERGETLLQVYRKHGVNTDLVQVLNDYPTGVVHVELTENGLPTFMIGENAAWDNWDWNQAVEEKVLDADAVYFGTLGQRGQSAREGIRRALEIGRTNKILRILDINLRVPFYDDDLIRDSIALCSVLKLSDEELNRVCQACGLSHQASQVENLAAIHQQYELDLVVMTQGSEGVILLSPEGITEQTGVPTTVVDTVGAGDSFTASMTLGLLKGESYAEILADACEVAAGVCSHAGAVPD